ncbi:MAG: hypothetical protein PHX40_00200 [Bacilli bacterium]|nr:hypothetical protein [Bacilli bacterium]
MKTRVELIDEISNMVLYEIIFSEKKNFNTKEKKDAEMIKSIKTIIEREVKKNDIQKNESN